MLNIKFLIFKIFLHYKTAENDKLIIIISEICFFFFFHNFICSQLYLVQMKCSNSSFNSSQRSQP